MTTLQLEIGGYLMIVSILLLEGAYLSDKWMSAPPPTPRRNMRHGVFSDWITHTTLNTAPVQIMQ